MLRLNIALLTKPDMETERDTVYRMADLMRHAPKMPEYDLQQYMEIVSTRLASIGNTSSYAFQ